MYHRSLYKKIILFTCIFTTMYPILQWEISKSATKDVPWNFELYNKSNNNIVFSVYDQGLLSFQPSEVLPPTELKSGAKLRIASMDTIKEITIKIWTEQNTENSKSVFNSARLMNIYKNRKREMIQNINNIPSDFIFKIKSTGRVAVNVPFNVKLKRGTIFLTWDGRTLRPQTGTLKGLSGKTDSGLDNRNNISPSEITKIID